MLVTCCFRFEPPVQQEASPKKPLAIEQLSRLYSFEQALEQTQERLIGVLKDWNQCPRSDLALLMDIKSRA
ncbi:unnamed protein product [Penicillium camemberti]|uniref:Str. FM013 n=1 Tax=Penicillium camemberti (strain FM 013) TaxID=1429867 RepID=A0A0G4PLS8_PENC3|nr:unnamed protein product [Penicillium camemberti]